jgi:perosamine synthetase
VIARRRTPIAAGALLQAWADTWRSDRDVIERFEAEFARYVGTHHALALCSGRAALLSALEGLGVGPGDEVILPAYTLADLPVMLAKAGIVPVFADVDADTYLLSKGAVAAAITPRTRAIVPTDLFGFADRWDVVLGDSARGIPLVEDAAHAAGSKLDGKAVGRRCKVAFFSLETIKVLHSFGGGILVTDDVDLAASVQKRLPNRRPGPEFVLKKFAKNALENLVFRTPVYQTALWAMDEPRVRGALLDVYDRVRRNGTLTSYGYGDVLAAFARSQLATLDQRVQVRRRLARELREGLRGALTFPAEPVGMESNYYFLVARTDREPAKLRRALVRAGIDVGIHSEICDFCPPLADRARYPNAYRAHRTLVQLPLYESMTDRDVARVVTSVRQALDSCLGEVSPE